MKKPRIKLQYGVWVVLYSGATPEPEINDAVRYCDRRNNPPPSPQPWITFGGRGHWRADGTYIPKRIGENHGRN